MDKTILLRDKPENLVSRLRIALQANEVPVEEIIIFGSYAKNSSRPDSDLDLCIVSNSFGKDSLKEMMELTKIASKIDPMIEVHPYTPYDLANRFDPLAKEIREYGIITR